MGMSTWRTILSEKESGLALVMVRVACTMDIWYLSDLIHDSATMVPRLGTSLSLGCEQLLPQTLGIFLPYKNGAPWAPFSL